MQYCRIKSRKCWLCKEIKSKNSFYKDSHDKYGIQKACKECQKERNNQYHKENREYFIRKGRESYKKENNKSRYLKYRTQYLLRRKQYSSTIIGRFNTLLSSARTRARKTNRKYELSLTWLLKKYQNQKGKCKLTNIELEFKNNIRRKRQFLPFSPSLHRLNENKGYTKENTILCCTGINIAMNRFKQSDFTQIIKGFLIKKGEK